MYRCWGAGDEECSGQSLDIHGRAEPNWPELRRTPNPNTATAAQAANTTKRYWDSYTYEWNAGPRLREHAEWVGAITTAHTTSSQPIFRTFLLLSSFYSLEAGQFPSHSDYSCKWPTAVLALVLCHVNEHASDFRISLAELSSILRPEQYSDSIPMCAQQKIVGSGTNQLGSIQERWDVPAPKSQVGWVTGHDGTRTLARP